MKKKTKEKQQAEISQVSEEAAEQWQSIQSLIRVRDSGFVWNENEIVFNLEVENKSDFNVSFFVDERYPLKTFTNSNETPSWKLLSGEVELKDSTLKASDTASLLVVQHLTDKDKTFLESFKTLKNAHFFIELSAIYMKDAKGEFILSVLGTRQRDFMI